MPITDDDPCDLNAPCGMTLREYDALVQAGAVDFDPTWHKRGPVSAKGIIAIKAPRWALELYALLAGHDLVTGEDLRHVFARARTDETWRASLFSIHALRGDDALVCFARKTARL